MKKLEISWQRLVSDGKTCPRCGGTEDELEKAVSNLKESLGPLGITVIFEKKELSVAKFKEAPLQSNMIIINNKSLENWIDGEVGESQCCDVCGPTECRTTKIEGQTYEEIPAELIIKAGLIAATKIVGSGEDKSCCGDKFSGTNTGCC